MGRPLAGRCCQFVVVDAIDAKAASFYAHHGFLAVPKNPFRLVQKVNDIAAALGV